MRDGSSQLLIVVGGKGGCGCTCKHPAVVAPIRASIATITRIATSMVLDSIVARRDFDSSFQPRLGEGKGG